MLGHGRCTSAAWRSICTVAHACRQRRAPLRLGLIGYGAIGAEVAAALRRADSGIPAEVAAILVHRRREPPPQLPAGTVFTADPEAFFAADWALGVEAAGQPAVAAYGERCLSDGRDLLVTSIGAFTSDSLLARCQRAAEHSGARLLLASGALPAVDWLHAACLAGPGKVTIRQVKPPKSWVGSRIDAAAGTPAPDTHDFHRLSCATVVYRGTAREAATLYPKNANVSALLALATVGLDQTTVELVADPSGRFATEIEFDGEPGSLRLQVDGRQSPTNPRTSAIVPLSVLRSIRNLCAGTVYGQ